jgi:hypothetical protein
MLTMSVNSSNPYERISDVAARVGVKPYERVAGKAVLIAKGADGKEYDVFEVVIAALDKIDAAMKRMDERLDGYNV